MGTSKSSKSSRTKGNSCVVSSINMPGPRENVLLVQLLVYFRKSFSFLQEPASKAAGLLTERE